MRAGSLCKRHADAMVVPRGWTLDDRRDAGRACSAPRRRRGAAPAPRRRRPAAGVSAARHRGAGAADQPMLAARWRPTGTAARSTRPHRRRGHRRAARRRRSRRHRGHPVAADVRRAATTSTACSRRAARCWPGRSAARDRHALMHTTRRAAHRRRHGRRRVRAGRRRSTATRRGCASCTASSALEPDDGRPAWRVELRARVGPFARSKQLRMVRTELRARSPRALRADPGRRARPRRVGADGDRRRRPTAARIVVTELTYSGKLWGSACCERVARRRDPARQGRARRASSASSPRAEAAVGPALQLEGEPEALARAASASRTSSIGPGAEHPAAAQQQHVGRASAGCRRRGG